jgi:acetyl-CoA synthetase
MADEDLSRSGAKTYPVIDRVADGANIAGMDAYNAMYNKSVEDPSAFWGKQATDMLSWFRPFDNVFQGSFEQGDIAWFTGGTLNVSYNCIDRHIANGKGEDTAIIWEADDAKDSRYISFNEVLREVCKIANVMKDLGVKKGDCVTIYLPMIPQCAYTMLACSRIGAVHSVVFAGFSAEALRDRIIDGDSHYCVTADGGLRGGRVTKLKDITDKAIDGVSAEHGEIKTLLFKRTGEEVVEYKRDIWMEPLMANARPYCPPVHMDAEDTLFFLYTSGSTGKPKGVLHSTAGYLLYTAMTQKYVFDYRPGDVFACVADCGWITGHSYIVYGPLCNGATTVMFESTPIYPDASRYWDMCERHGVTQFYTAPTAIRLLMKFGTEPIKKHDLSKLRVLGTVGEPINPEAWVWYHTEVGKEQCAIVDTWWQTETGGNMLTSLPACTPTKPGAASLPFFGVQPMLLDKDNGSIVEGNSVQGVLVIKHPWPGMARTVFGNHERYLNVYMRPYGGYYFTGDGCVRDKDGYYWITGRVDDVMNVSGHRLGTAEIESALVAHDSCAEAAVVGVPHDVKGEGIFCYCILMAEATPSAELVAELANQIRTSIGPFAKPERIVIVPGLPKTRSGKIMRRILRKVAAAEYESLGDVSTLADPSVVDKIIAAVKA